MEFRPAFGQIAETRDVEAAWPPVIQGAGLADQILHESGDGWSHHVFAEIVTDVTAGVADAVGIRLDLDSNSSRAVSNVDAASSTALAFDLICLFCCRYR